MLKIPFSKWSPGGNTTLFLPNASLPSEHQAQIIQQLLSPEKLAAEQAGFIDLFTPKLTMAGGEFCLNASAAFAARLSMEEKKNDFAFAVSGWPETIIAHVQENIPHFQSQLSLRLNFCHCKHLADKNILCRLPGITHILINGEHTPYPSDPKATIHALCQKYKLSEEFCVGAIWWYKQNQNYHIKPIVSVKAIATVFEESACGSGALAVMMMLAEEGHSSAQIWQPSGFCTHITHNQNMATITSQVDLIAQGEVWID
ncbi:MAG: hypothetical protein IK079_04965 [Desulfovibrio sp.]|nr:hypothetical protein [Desulfovibrio sp.]